MKFLQELYLGEKIIPKVDGIVKRIKTEKVVPNLYLITMASHPDNMLDLVPEWEELQKGYPKETLRIVGLAENKKAAIKLMQSIIEESIKVTGSADIRAYLEVKWEGQA